MLSCSFPSSTKLSNARCRGRRIRGVTRVDDGVFDKCLRILVIRPRRSLVELRKATVWSRDRNLRTLSKVLSLRRQKGETEMF
jgi:hypothetical protein